MKRPRPTARVLLFVTLLAGATAPQDAPSADAPAVAHSPAPWSEPVRFTDDGTDTWSWEDDAACFELVVRGTPTVDDARTALVWVAEPDAEAGREGFALTVESKAGEDGPTVIRAVNLADARRPQLVGELHGETATHDALREALAQWLPAVMDHLGLDIDHRVERALMDKGLRAALKQIATQTSSAARLRGYSAIARELDEPGGKALARLLGQAGRDLTSARDLLSFLIEDMDIGLDSRATTAAVVEALAGVKDQDVLANVLAQLMVQTDDAPPGAMVVLLEFATLRLTRDHSMATLLDAVSWQGLGSRKAREAWRDALATVEADAPHARAVADMLSIGDAPAAECTLVVQSAVAHIETESLRAQALAEIHLEQLEDAKLEAAYLAALRSFRDADVLTDLLITLARRHDAPVATSALLLRAGRNLPGDGHLSSLLRAIPAEHLADDAVEASYRSLADKLWEQSARADVLKRLREIDPDHQE